LTYNLTFLFSRNRLNVAISRAQCLAYPVCSSRLLEARCNSIEEMDLVNTLAGSLNTHRKKLFSSLKRQRDRP